MTGTSGRSGGCRKPFLPTMKLDGKATDLPEKPGSLSGAESKCWDSILSKLPTECLAPIDVFELTQLVRLVVQSDDLNEMIKADPADMKARRLSLQVFAAIHKFQFCTFSRRPKPGFLRVFEPNLNYCGVWVFEYTPE